jgi:hypothetical protein
VVAPGVEAAFEDGGVEAVLEKLTRHTGARGFVWSGAVGDD